MKTGPAEAPNSLEYEVRCHQCKTSFAKGTRRCIHCGGRLGGAPEISLSLELPTRDEDGGEVAVAPGRAIVWAMTAVVALVGFLLRLCSGGG